MYNLDQLRMFVASADSGSFSAAARSLNKAQSAISTGIANLETDLNCQLFDRSQRSPVLTEEGQQLLIHARAVLQQSQLLDNTALAINQPQERDLRIAFDSALMTPQLGRLFQQLGQQFAAMRLHLLNINSDQVIDAVIEQRADIGLMFSDMSFNQQVELSFLGSIELCAVASPEHPLSALESADISDLRQYRQLHCGQDNREKEELCHQIILSPDYWCVDNFHDVLMLVKQNCGWSYMPQSLAQEAINNGQLRQLPMRLDQKNWQANIDRVTRQHAPLGPAGQWLCQRLSDVY